MRPALSRWTVGVVAAFLWLCPHLRMYTDESVRYYAFWARRDAAALAVGIVLLGTALFLAHALTRMPKVRWIDRAADAIEINEPFRLTDLHQLMPARRSVERAVQKRGAEPNERTRG